MRTPYFEAAGVTVYHGDCRDILTEVTADTVITDPVWPDADVPLEGRGAEDTLLRDALELCEGADRVAVQVGCDTDPRFQAAVPPPTGNASVQRGWSYPVKDTVGACCTPETWRICTAHRRRAATGTTSFQGAT